ncbi:MAG: hypothetical protein VSS75_023850 [Candidatus Parabeggiatoa sp.]|nr:hypothetical protein [Candidatus Parabeggiatoa sp.]
MIKPEDVKPHNFKDHKILYNDGNFSIAWGKWENGDKHLAMRWNGGPGDVGYPKAFGNPVWFLIPRNLSIPILRGVLGAEFSDCGVIATAIDEICKASTE